MESLIGLATVADVRPGLERYREADAEPIHTDDQGSLRQLIARDPVSLLLAEFGAHILDSVGASWDGWREFIYRLVVAHGLRRQGLGRQLLIAAESRLQKAEAERCQAVVVETDARAGELLGSQRMGETGRTASVVKC